MKIYDYAGKKNISGERIREARTKLHLTQTNLAVQLKLAGVDVERDSISRIEIGTRFVTDYEICELSKILKVFATMSSDELKNISHDQRIPFCGCHSDNY